MTDASADSNVNRPHRIKEYDDPHFHDEDDADGSDEKRDQRQPTKNKPLKRRPPPPRRRYEE